MSREGDKCAKGGLRSQKRGPRREPPPKVAPTPGGAESRAAAPQGKRPGKAPPPGAAEYQRKLSDASNASEDLSKDSGCPSGKVSSSDSSSEISDCPSEGNKLDSPSGDELSWVDGRAYERPGEPGEPGRGRAPAAGVFNSAGTLMDLMMMAGESTDDLVREVDDLRSENEYLKDEVEELRCEMLEMRDMFQEEEVYQLQELRLQLEQANKTCRILHYRLRKAERRSIRVAQTGQVDGELVRTLEHDIKVAKSVSLRLYNELEVVRKKNVQLEWENEALREKTQELEVAKQVLQAEADKVKESSIKKKSIRSAASKAERRLSQQMEDDSADLRCQLHFAKEELALMCKKLTKMVSESEAMHEQLAKYRAAYGDLAAAAAASPPDGRPNPAHSREAELKVHLRLVEEEATLLSRRIVELEVENRGLRAEMSDLREKVGGACAGGEEEEEEEGEERKRDGAMEKGGEENGRAQESAREGPVGGEPDPPPSQEGGGSGGEQRPEGGVRGLSLKDCRTLVGLRDHACVLSSAIQLLVAPPPPPHTNGVRSPPPPPPGTGTEAAEALELLQAMLLAFIGRVETLLSVDERGRPGAGGPDGGAKEEVAAAVAAARGGPGIVHSCREPRMQLSLQILWILHQWCQVKGPAAEAKEVGDKSVSVLRGLLQNVSAELQEERPAGEVTAGRGAQRVGGGIRPEERPLEAGSSAPGRSGRALPPPPPPGKKNWCYVSREAAQLDREDPVKTWDHLIMPLSFPELDLERMWAERSHTAPEKSAVRIYYSPPSARRVRLAQLLRSPEAAEAAAAAEAASPESASSLWCTPPSSLSTLCLGSAANLSDDMKEMTAGWRQALQAGPPRRPGRWADVCCSGTQTHAKPQMVSVGLQTDSASAAAVRTSPSRLLASSLASRSHMSSSLDRLSGRMDRSRAAAAAAASSPKLYRRHSASGASSSSAATNLSSPSASPSPRDRALWNSVSQPGPAWTRQGGQRAAAAGHNAAPELPARGGGKPPSKAAGGGRCGLVSEFLRRVSGRVEKPAAAGAGAGPKTRGGAPKNLERAPARTPAAAAAPLHRSDSVTRIVNQRFMKQREESGRSQKEESGRSQREEKSGSLNSARSSPSSGPSEEGNYDCSSGGSLSFCFARPSRLQRPPSSQTKLQRHRYTAAVSAAAAAAAATTGCE